MKQKFEFLRFYYRIAAKSWKFTFLHNLCVDMYNLAFFESFKNTNVPKEWIFDLSEQFQAIYGFKTYLKWPFSSIFAPNLA